MSTDDDFQLIDEGDRVIARHGDVRLSRRFSPDTHWPLDGRLVVGDEELRLTDLEMSSLVRCARELEARS